MNETTTIAPATPAGRVSIVDAILAYRLGKALEAFARRAQRVPAGPQEMAVNPQRRRRTELEAEHGITTGRQWVRFRREYDVYVGLDV